MKMWHITHRELVPSILAAGLAPGLATGDKRVWLTHTKRARTWAHYHVGLTHRWFPPDLVTFEIEMEYNDVLRSGRAGVVYVRETIAPDRLKLLPAT